MRLHFHLEPWDLYAVVAYTVVIAAVLLALNVGNPIAILLVLFVPGYVLVAALFPGSSVPQKRELDWIERLALSFSLSIAIVPLLGLLLSFSPWGIRFAPIVVEITLFTVVVGCAAYWRRMRLPPDERLSLTVDLAIPNWKDYGLVDKGLTVAIASTIVVAGGTFAYLVLMPRSAETFTEFYILGPGGKASGYPTALNVSQPGTVTLGIVNHEATRVNYTIRIDLVGVRLVHNATSGFNETVEINRTTWSTFNVTLAESQNWTEPYTFQINAIGLWKVQFLLLRDGAFLSVYRELHLFVRVT